MACDRESSYRCAYVMSTATGIISDCHLRSFATTNTVNGDASYTNGGGAAISKDGHNNAADTKVTDRQEEVRRVAHERLAGRRRFFKVVSVAQVKPVSSDSISSMIQTHAHDNGIASPISAGVDGTDSGSGIVHPEKIAARNAMRKKDQDEHSTYFGITLDGKRIRTPAGQNFEVPSQALAVAIAAEWDAQRTHINPTQMPLMTLACTALDQTAADPETVIQNCLRYLPSDTTSFLADPIEDRVLARKQKLHWEHLRKWSSKILGDVPATTNAIVSIGKGKGLPHPDIVYRKAEDFVRSLENDIWKLTVLQCATVEAKSFLVGLGIVKKYLSPSQAIEAARVEEEFQIENWGCVEGGHDYDRLNCSIQMRSASFLLEMIESGNGSV